MSVEVAQSSRPAVDQQILVARDAEAFAIAGKNVTQNAENFPFDDSRPEKKRKARKSDHRAKVIRKAELGDILEIHYCPHTRQIHAAYSASSSFQPLPDRCSTSLDKSPEKPQAFIFQEKTLCRKETTVQGIAMAKPCIRFDASHTLFFNTLMDLESIKVFVEGIGEADRDKIERVAFRKDFLLDEFNQATMLDILGRLPNLKIAKIVFEIPSREDGKDCLGPRGIPAEMVDFYTPAYVYDINVPILPFQAILNAIDILQTYRSTQGSGWIETPKVDAVAVIRNRLKTNTTSKDQIEEDIETERLGEETAKLEEEAARPEAEAERDAEKEARANISRAEREQEIEEDNEFWEGGTWDAGSDDEDFGQFSDGEDLIEA